MLEPRRPLDKFAQALKVSLAVEPNGIELQV
jgi:hypothetical protein